MHTEYVFLSLPVFLVLNTVSRRSPQLLSCKLAENSNSDKPKTRKKKKKRDENNENLSVGHTLLNNSHFTYFVTPFNRRKKVKY